MIKNKIVVESGDYTYDIETGQENGKVTLKRSESQSWVHPGQKVAKLKDNGNGVKITHEDLGKIKMDYSQTMEIYYLLHEFVITKHGPNKGEFKIIEV